MFATQREEQTKSEGREVAIAAVFATQREEGREVAIAAVFATQREEKLL